MIEIKHQATGNVLFATDVENMAEAVTEAFTAKVNLRGANLSHADLCNVNLCGADLSYANLHSADLSNSHLHSADLRGAILTRTNLEYSHLASATLNFTDLVGANLSSADLKDANFSKADLSYANLSKVILVLTNLSYASLLKTNFTAAHCDGTVFEAVNLSIALGLSDVVHQGRSGIGISTLYESGDNIPEVFLRGCGVPENLITYLPSLVAPGAIDFYSCFISYSHDDKSFAQRLHNDLQSKGIRCWLDEHQMLPGDKLYTHVDKAIRLWDKVLLCASESSLNSWWVEREIDTAMEKEMNLRQERGEAVLSLIPLNLDGHLFDWQGAHGAELRSRLAADFTGWESDNKKYEEQFERIVKSLRADDFAREKPPMPKL